MDLSFLGAPACMAIVSYIMMYKICTCICTVFGRGYMDIGITETVYMYYHSHIQIHAEGAS